MNLIITGAAGFIGSAFLRLALQHKLFNKIIVVDALTYAGRKENFISLVDEKNVFFEKCDIRNQHVVESVLAKYTPFSIVHLAAESHVDNSINGPRLFVETNITGTLNLLESFRAQYIALTESQKETTRFVHVSTDEVFGELGPEGKFTEFSSYNPSSPYSASKAGSDHLVKSWQRTFGLPCIITNCSNNYGPRQFPEKLIPLMILNALNEKPLPVYGNGLNVRDWIHVEDHSEGIWLALTKGTPGNSYCFGGNSEKTNIQVVKLICESLDKLRPRSNGKSYQELITYVTDRKGHDFRYAIDDTFAAKELNFKRNYNSLEAGLKSTIQWYLDNMNWVSEIKKG